MAFKPSKNTKVFLSVLNTLTFNQWSEQQLVEVTIGCVETFIKDIVF